MIRKFLDLSNHHLTQKTCDALYADEIDVLAWHENGEGVSCIVYVPREPSDMEGVPDDLMGCIHHARSLGCDRINFDRDADTVDGLPVYDW